MDRRKLVQAIFNCVKSLEESRPIYGVSDDCKYVLSVWPTGIKFDSAEYKEAIEMHKELKKIQMYQELK
jgi:hypothetical protein